MCFKLKLSTEISKIAFLRFIPKNYKINFKIKEKTKCNKIKEQVFVYVESGLTFST
jgi:hypothetical protein